MPAPGPDLSGKRFHRLVVLGPIKVIDINRNRWWVCKCDCGSYTKARTNDLHSGNTKSCGCLRAEKARERMRNADRDEHGYII